MLGGGEWVRAPDDPDRKDDVVFLDDALENPGDLAFSLVLTTSRLLPNRYPEDREALADRVVEMREGQGMTFPATAELLSAEGAKGARGAALNAKGAYSIYKKRKAYLARRTEPIQYRIDGIVVYPRKGKP